MANLLARQKRNVLGKTCPQGRSDFWPGLQPFLEKKERIPILIPFPKNRWPRFYRTPF